jgi:hypothetical protein
MQGAEHRWSTVALGWGGDGGAWMRRRRRRLAKDLGHRCGEET